MARRTSRPRVVWLPQDPTQSIDAATLAGSTVMSAIDALVAVNVGDSITTGPLPLVRDISPNPLTPGNTLADINQSGYRLRRIVGKIWVNCPQQAAAGNNQPGAAVVTAAIIVLRTDPQAGAPQNPVGATYATNDIVNTEAPWVWRRSWLIVNVNSGNATRFSNILVSASGDTPNGASNWNVGGVLDGPHVDAKTARIVGPDERLFLVFTSTALTTGGAQESMPLSFVWDLRFLASMRSMVGNRRNASR